MFRNAQKCSEMFRNVQKWLVKGLEHSDEFSSVKAICWWQLSNRTFAPFFSLLTAECGPNFFFIRTSYRKSSHVVVKGNFMFYNCSSSFEIFSTFCYFFCQGKLQSSKTFQNLTTCWKMWSTLSYHLWLASQIWSYQTWKKSLFSSILFVPVIIFLWKMRLDWKKGDLSKISSMNNTSYFNC